MTNQEHTDTNSPDDVVAYQGSLEDQIALLRRHLQDAIEVNRELVEDRHALRLQLATAQRDRDTRLSFVTDNYYGWNEDGGSDHWYSKGRMFLIPHRLRDKFNTAVEAADRLISLNDDGSCTQKAREEAYRAFDIQWMSYRTQWDISCYSFTECRLNEQPIQ